MNFLSRLSQRIALRWRLGVILIISMLSLILMGFAGIWTVHAVNRQVIKLSTEIISSMEMLVVLQSSMKESQSNLLEMTLPGATDADIEKTYNQAKSELTKFNEHLTKMGSTSVSTQESDQIKAIQKAWLVFQEDINRSLDLVISGAAADREIFATQYRTSLEPARLEIQKQLNELSQNYSANSRATRADSDELTARLRLFLMTGVAVLLAVIALSGFFLIRNIDAALHQIMASVLAHSHEVFGSAKRVDAISETLDDGAQNTSSSLQVCVTGLTEISQMVEKANQNAIKSTQLSNLAKEASVSGDKAVAQIAEAMQGIEGTTGRFVQNMEESAQDVSVVAKIFQEVTEKARLINDIVFQTKLLSFNASVEAARAGEYGKGFSVVAEEVAKLSKMTGEVAGQISQLLVASSKQVNDIVERIQITSSDMRSQATEVVRSGITKVDRGRDHLKSIVQHSLDVKFNTDQISSATREQSEAIQEISNSLNKLQQLADNNATKAHDSKDVVHKLLNSATMMEETVESLQKFLDGSQVDSKSSNHKSDSSHEDDDASDDEEEDDSYENDLPKVS